MNYDEFKNRIISECESLGVKDYEIYYSKGEDTSLDVFAHEINGFSSSEEGGLCFRCIHNGKMGYASTETLDEENARDLVLRAIDNASVLESDEEVFIADGGQDYQEIEDRSYPLPTTQEMVETALETQEKIYKANKLVIDGTQTQVMRETYTTAIYNSRGLDLKQESSSAGVVVSAVVTNGKEMTDSYEIKLGELDKMDIDALVKKCTDDAERKLGGEVAPTGQYPVVFSEEAMSDLLKTFCSVFSSDKTQKGLSRMKGLEGTQVASECVTIIDDPFHKDNPMPMMFDAEGCPTRKKEIVKDGKLVTLLYNMKTAAVDKKKTTGNASKSKYSSPIEILPFSMYIENGESTEDEILKKAGNGIYINSVTGLHAGANPVTGDFSLQSEGFMLENGEKTKYVKSFTVAGNFYQMLKNITMVANNCKLPNAFGSTAFGSPTVLVEGLSISGK